MLSNLSREVGIVKITRKWKDILIIIMQLRSSKVRDKYYLYRRCLQTICGFHV